MKFQDSSFNGLKVTIGTKSVTNPRTNAPKAICPINFFKVVGIISGLHLPTFRSQAAIASEKFIVSLFLIEKPKLPNVTLSQNRPRST